MAGALRLRWGVVVLAIASALSRIVGSAPLVALTGPITSVLPNGVSRREMASRPSAGGFEPEHLEGSISGAPAPAPPLGEGTEGRIQFGTPMFWAYAGISVFSVLFAGFASGMTVGLLSIDPIQLKVSCQHGTEEEKTRARNVSRIVEDHHLLLVTLLLANSIAMEALPVFLDRLMPSWLAVLLSVTCILFFGEVLPQAFCTGPKQLIIAAACAPVVRVLMGLLFVIAWPIAKLLDRLLGHEAETYYSRPHLKTLIRMHQKGQRAEKDASSSGAAKSGESDTSSALGMDEVVVIEGALDLANKTLRELLVPEDRIFMLEWDTRLTKPIMLEVLRAGHSRVPVYRGARNNVRGLMLVKSLILVNPDDGVRAYELMVKKSVLFETPETSAYDMLNEFQKGSSHMAFVTEHCEEYRTALKTGVDVDPKASIVGVATLEDVMEELIQEEIYDEFDSLYLPHRPSNVDAVPEALQNSLHNSIPSLASSRSIVHIGSLRALSKMNSSVNQPEVSESLLGKSSASPIKIETSPTPEDTSFQSDTTKEGRAASWDVSKEPTAMGQASTVVRMASTSGGPNSRRVLCVQRPVAPGGGRGKSQLEGGEQQPQSSATISRASSKLVMSRLRSAKFSAAQRSNTTEGGPRASVGSGGMMLASSRTAVRPDAPCSAVDWETTGNVMPAGTPSPCPPVTCPSSISDSPDAILLDNCFTPGGDTSHTATRVSADKLTLASASMRAADYVDDADAPTAASAVGGNGGSMWPEWSTKGAAVAEVTNGGKTGAARGGGTGSAGDVYVLMPEDKAAK